MGKYLQLNFPIVNTLSVIVELGWLVFSLLTRLQGYTSTPKRSYFSHKNHWLASICNIEDEAWMLQCLSKIKITYFH